MTGGQTLTYTLAVSNAGTGASGTVVITDPMPGGTSYVDGSASCGSVPNCAVTNTGPVTFTLSSVAAGASGLVLTFRTTVATTATGDVTNTATYSDLGGCTGASCSTNTVRNPISNPAVAAQKAVKPVTSATGKSNNNSASTTQTGTVVSGAKNTPVVGATSVHTGEPWAGTKVLVIIAMAFGLCLVALGETIRRRSRRSADQRGV